MPELPEVESIRRGLEAHIVGHSITAVHVEHPRPVRWHPHGPAGFSTELTGRVFDVPARRGKYLWLPFRDGDALLVHLRMSGQFHIDPIDQPTHRHTRVRFSLDDGRELRYVDQRMLGGLQLSVGGAGRPPEIAHVAADPWSPDFDPNEVAHVIVRKRSPIKSVLLNQQVVSGIGNIYADEALWRARLHYATLASTQTLAAAKSLLEHASAVMSEALEQGGTSFDDLYVQVNGQSGYFARHLSAYGRAGQPCERCETPILRERLTNRSSYFCPCVSSEQAVDDLSRPLVARRARSLQVFTHLRDTPIAPATPPPTS